MLSVSDKLLLAAYELEEKGQSPFSAEDLVVAAWQKFPDTFGLAGYRSEGGKLSYPDSNRVFAEIMGSKPIRKRGFLIKVGDKMYRLTEAGSEYAKHLLNRSRESPIEKAGLARPTTDELRRLLDSKAFQKVRNQRLSDVTFYDACAFWGITPMSSAIDLKGRVAKLERIVESARSVLQNKSVTFEHSGLPFGGADLDALLGVHTALLNKFREELEVIGERKDERKV